MGDTAENVIIVKNAKKIYKMGSETIKAVDDISFEIKKGEFCCLLGTSGSGKSTLLNLMAGIEKITSGEITIKGKRVTKMSEKSLARFRQRYLGFVFQSYNLLPNITALENVEFPLIFKRIPGKRRKKTAKEILIKVGLGKRLKHKPSEMSGGQQQRVGIARAFVAKPEIIFADEPTGNLDTKTTKEVMELIKSMAKENNQTIVMVTHDPSIASYADKIIHIIDGCIDSIRLQDELAADVKKEIEKGEVSAETEVSAGTEVPSETGVSAGTEVSTETGVSVGTEVSAETEISDGTEVSAETEVPAETKVSAETEVSAETVAPAETEVSAETVVPAETEVSVTAHRNGKGKQR